MTLTRAARKATKSESIYRTQLEAPTENWYGQLVAVQGVMPTDVFLDTSTPWFPHLPVQLAGVEIMCEISGDDDFEIWLLRSAVSVATAVLPTGQTYLHQDLELVAFEPDESFQIAVMGIGDHVGVSMKALFLSPNSGAGTVLFVEDFGE
jgi:hypothetical protein